MKTGYTALIHCQSGGGKTYNSLQLPGKKILLSSDTSYMFAVTKAKDVEVMDITRWLKDKDGKELCFNELFEAAVAKKPTTIIIDNLSDLIDMAVLELIGSDGASKDNRQSYQAVYLDIRRLVRKANFVGCNVLFTAWTDVDQLQLPSGELVQRFSPKLPKKITDNVCGLCNLVGYVSTAEDKNGTKRWYYNLTGSKVLIAKDQIWSRKNCLPADLFSAPQATKNKED